MKPIRQQESINFQVLVCAWYSRTVVQAGMRVLKDGALQPYKETLREM
jgi:hypothetical protein